MPELKKFATIVATGVLMAVPVMAWGSYLLAWWLV
jgi:hypothetical protein